jgi:hypothetical protein
MRQSTRETQDQPRQCVGLYLTPFAAVQVKQAHSTVTATGQCHSHLHQTNKHELQHDREVR